MPLNPDAVTAILEEAAAQEILPRFRALADHEVREKRSGDLVTVADEAAERYIERRLRDLLPGAQVIGEEAVEADPGLLDRLDDADLIWVIDPIDGTGNFARGKPVFAVMVALLRNRDTVGAWIHDPVGGRTAVAEEGSGAWLNGTRLQVAAPAMPREMNGTLHAGTFAPPALARQLQQRRDRVGAVKSLRCAGHEYLRLARAETHFSLFTKLMPWDHAPGALIHREAGGVARTFDGADYAAHRIRAGGLMLAPDPSSWRALHGVLLADTTQDRTLPRGLRGFTRLALACAVRSQ